MLFDSLLPSVSSYPMLHTSVTVLPTLVVPLTASALSVVGISSQCSGDRRTTHVRRRQKLGNDLSVYSTFYDIGAL